jgi:hypothetical protein
MKYLIQLFNFFFSNNNDPWQYGTVDGYKARRHRKNKNVQFILWKAGQEGHQEDFWHDFDESWWVKFIPDNN